MNGNRRDKALNDADRRKGWVLFFFILQGLISHASLLTAQPIQNAQQPLLYAKGHKEAMQSILNCSPEAHAQVAALANQYPHHPANIYLENYLAFVGFIAYEKPIDAQTFAILAERRMKLIDQIASSAHAAVYKCNMHMQITVVESIKGNLTTALRHAWKANQLCKQIPDGKPFDQEKEKLTAILSTIFANVPETYRWMANLMALDLSDQDTGNRLYNYAQSQTGTVGLGDEAQIIHLFINLKLPPKMSAFPDIGFVEAAQGKPLMTYALGLIAIKNKVRTLSFNEISEKECRLFPPLYYIKGRTMLNNLAPDAYLQLSGYLSSFKGNSFRADALMRLSWFYLTLGDTASAFHWANKGLKIGTLPTYADKQAKHELESIKQTIPQLIQARLLYDAGKPLESKNLLLKNAWLATQSPSEYHYRLARALHDLNSPLEALPHYKAAIANNTTPLKYYAPFSALMVALIEHEHGNRQQSLRYAKLCLSINKGEYANDIKTKAQELIKTLGQQSPATK